MEVKYTREQIAEKERVYEQHMGEVICYSKTLKMLTDNFDKIGISKDAESVISFQSAMLDDSLLRYMESSEELVECLEDVFIIHARDKEDKRSQSIMFDHREIMVETNRIIEDAKNGEYYLNILNQKEQALQSQPSAN